MLFANTLTGSALSKEQSTVINIGDPDGPPRLVRFCSFCYPVDSLTVSRSHTSPLARASTGIPVRSPSVPGFSRTPLTDDENAEIFLPSYLDCDYVPLENRREPVHEIRLSEEELRNMLPQ